MRSLAVALAMGVALAGGAALAEKYDDKDNAVFLKGGIGGYTGELGDQTAAGPVWGVALNVQPSNILGFEFGYDGSRNALDDDRISQDNTPSANRHGASALMKLGLPFIERVKPFVGAGLAASYVSINGDTGGLYRSDFMQEVPLTGGIELNSGFFHAGFRAGYRILIDEGFADPAQTGGNPEGGIMDMTATIGGRF